MTEAQFGYGWETNMAETHAKLQNIYEEVSLLVTSMATSRDYWYNEVDNLVSALQIERDTWRQIAITGFTWIYGDIAEQYAYEQFVLTMKDRDA